jgi:uncharacterized membrane protein HdeD (DUF308 family)
MPGDHRLLVHVILFGLGAATVPLISWSQRNTELPYGWRVAGPVLLVCFAAGLIEAAVSRQTGRRQWIGSWLPLALGVLAAMAVGDMHWRASYGATPPPDAGMAMGLAMTAVLFGMPIVGLLVNAVALLAARLLGPVPLAPRGAGASSGRSGERPQDQGDGPQRLDRPQVPATPASPWPQASLELLDALGRNAWLPLAHAAVAAASAVAIVLRLDVLPQILPACAIADGMLAIVAARLSHDRSEARWWPANAGLIGISAGILTLVWPLAMLILIVLLCIWGVASGMLLISGANRPQGALRNAQLVRLAGVASLTLGVVSLHLLLSLFI